MRIGQLKSLTEDELALCLYIVNVIAPTTFPKLEYTPRQLTWFKHDALLWKVAQQEAKLTDEGKKIFHGLMTKLNRTWIQEVTDHENSSREELTQPDFSI
jgi:hypothetical protein